MDEDDHEYEKLQRDLANHPTLVPLRGIWNSATTLEWLGLVVVILLSLILWRLW